MSEASLWVALVAEDGAAFGGDHVHGAVLVAEGIVVGGQHVGQLDFFWSNVARELKLPTKAMSENSCLVLGTVWTSASSSAT